MSQNFFPSLRQTPPSKPDQKKLRWKKLLMESGAAHKKGTSRKKGTSVTSMIKTLMTQEKKKPGGNSYNVSHHKANDSKYEFDAPLARFQSIALPVRDGYEREEPRHSDIEEERLLQLERSNMHLPRNRHSSHSNHSFLVNCFETRTKQFSPNRVRHARMKSEQSFDQLEEEMKNLHKLVKGRSVTDQTLADNLEFEARVQKQKEAQKQFEKGKLRELKQQFRLIKEFGRCIRYNTYYSLTKDRVPELQGLEKQKVKNEQYVINFPALHEPVNFDKIIEQYKPLSPQFSVKEAQKERNYFREFSNNNESQFIYFGGHDDRNRLHGLGVFINPRKILEGHWVHGELIKGGELKKTGTYLGEFKQNKKHGEGILKLVNGEQYEGNWWNGEKHGRGNWQSSEGEFYVGDWKNNNAEGYGLFESPNGLKYKGEFKDFRKHGKGHEFLPNGDEYIGYFETGKPHGIGTYKWINELEFEGTFRQGSRFGEGKLEKKNSFTYLGHFFEDAAEGEGLLKLSNGSIIHKLYKHGIDKTPQSPENNRIRFKSFAEISDSEDNT